MFSKSSVFPQISKYLQASKRMLYKSQKLTLGGSGKYFQDLKERTILNDEPVIATFNTPVRLMSTKSSNNGDQYGDKSDHKESNNTNNMTDEKRIMEKKSHDDIKRTLRKYSAKRRRKDSEIVSKLDNKSKNENIPQSRVHIEYIESINIKDILIKKKPLASKNIKYIGGVPNKSEEVDKTNKTDQPTAPVKDDKTFNFVDFIEDLKSQMSEIQPSDGTPNKNSEFKKPQSNKEKIPSKKNHNKLSGNSKNPQQYDGGYMGLYKFPKSHNKVSKHIQRREYAKRVGWGFLKPPNKENNTKGKSKDEDDFSDLFKMNIGLEEINEKDLENKDNVSFSTLKAANERKKKSKTKRPEVMQMDRIDNEKKMIYNMQPDISEDKGEDEDHIWEIEDKKRVNIKKSDKYKLKSDSYLENDSFNLIDEYKHDDLHYAEADMVPKTSDLQNDPNIYITDDLPYVPKQGGTPKPKTEDTDTRYFKHNFGQDLKSVSDDKYLFITDNLPYKERRETNQEDLIDLVVNSQNINPNKVSSKPPSNNIKRELHRFPFINKVLPYRYKTVRDDMDDKVEIKLSEGENSKDGVNISAEDQTINYSYSPPAIEQNKESKPIQNADFICCLSFQNENSETQKQKVEDAVFDFVNMKPDLYFMQPTPKEISSEYELPILGVPKSLKDELKMKNKNTDRSSSNDKIEQIFGFQNKRYELLNDCIINYSSLSENKKLRDTVGDFETDFTSSNSDSAKASERSNYIASEKDVEAAQDSAEASESGYSHSSEKDTTLLIDGFQNKRFQLIKDSLSLNPESVDSSVENKTTPSTPIGANTKLAISHQDEDLPVDVVLTFNNEKGDINFEQEDIKFDFINLKPDLFYIAPVPKKIEHSILNDPELSVKSTSKGSQTAVSTETEIETDYKK